MIKRENFFLKKRCGVKSLVLIALISISLGAYAFYKRYYEVRWASVSPASRYQTFCIVVPSYNNADVAIKNLESVTSQQYDKWRMYIIDDASTDGMYDLLRSHVQKHNLEGKVTLIRNEKNQGALANIYNTVHEHCRDEEVVVRIDGDDWLNGPHVLERVNKVYESEEVWLTLGSLGEAVRPERFLHGIIPFGKIWDYCKKYTPEIRDAASYRVISQWGTVHLHTFYAKLFKKIKREDLIENNHFFWVVADDAILVPMLEMASPNHWHCIQDVLYVYNRKPNHSDHYLRYDQQVRVGKIIRSKPKYEKLPSLFEPEGKKATVRL